MAQGLGTLFITIAMIAFFAALIPGSSAKIHLQLHGSIEFPSLKCIANQQRVDVDIDNKTVCFGVVIYNTVPTWNCVILDGNGSIEELENLADTIKNQITSGSKSNIGGTVWAVAGTGGTLPGGKFNPMNKLNPEYIADDGLTPPTNVDEEEVKRRGIWAGKKLISKTPHDNLTGMAPRSRNV